METKQDDKTTPRPWAKSNPTPWVKSHDAVHRAIIGAPAGSGEEQGRHYIIAFTSGDKEIAEANVDLIVRAVNSHDQLVEASQEAVVHIAEGNPSKALVVLRAALSSVEGEAGR